MGIYLVLVFGVCGFLYLGIRGVCTLCRDKAIAEYNATASRNIATTAQQRQRIQTEIKRMPVSERRKVLNKWVVK